MSGEARPLAVLRDPDGAGGADADTDFGGDPERHASWLELFFDLVYVLAVAQLAAGLRDHGDHDGALAFVGLFAPVWWAWVGFTFFSSRFDHDDVGHRLLVLAGMAGSLGLAISVPAAFHGATAGYALAYAGVRFVLVAMYARAGWHDQATRPLTNFYVVAFTLGALLWVGSALVAPPIRYVIWAVALAVEVAAPVASRARFAVAPIDTSHLPERFGLFVLIVLGELVVTVGASVARAPGTGELVATSGLGFVIVATLWWSYFDVAMAFIRRQVARHPRSSDLARDIYSYGHFPVVLGLTALAAGAERGILESGHAGLDPAVRWSLCGGAACYLLALSGINRVLIERGRNYLVWTRVAVSAAVLVLAAVGGGLSPIVLFAVVAAGLLEVAAFGAIRVRRAGVDVRRI